MSNEKKKTWEPLPEGDYMVRMVNLEEKKTKKGDGVLLDCTYEIAKGDFKGRKIFGKFLVEHPSEKAQEIGNKMLNYYLEAVGVDGGLDGLGNDRTQLHDHLEIPFIAGVGIEEPREYTDKEGNTRVSKARNNIKVFKAR